ncbi:MAG: hypothetical protein ABI574_03615 [Burkholderiales bacterium]
MTAHDTALLAASPAPAVAADHFDFRGDHAHASTGEHYVYEGRYQPLGTMVDWSAHVRSAGGALSRVAGSIRLSRGQTHSVAGRLVGHMVAQAIDALSVATPAASPV